MPIQDGALVFADKNANTNKRINIADKTKLRLSGNDASNYTFSDASGSNNSGLTGTVTKKALTVDAILADRQYDGTANITVNSFTVTGVVRNDWTGATHPTTNTVLGGNLVLRAIVRDGSPNAGENKPVKVIWFNHEQ